MGKYDKVIELVFETNYTDGDIFVSFSREQLVDAHNALGIALSKNIGDIPYTYRFRGELPQTIRDTAPNDAEWVIMGSGVGLYEFRLASANKISPNRNCDLINIPDATPEIVKQYASGIDEQALLTRVRYNRIVDIFTGLTCYSLQNHLRTTVEGVGQVEVDEIYIALNKHGAHFVLPCQAKSQGEEFGIVQVTQDVLLCSEKYKNATCKPIAIQFVEENVIAILELKVRNLRDKEKIMELKIVCEKHYKLVPRSEISDSDLQLLKKNESDHPS